VPKAENPPVHKPSVPSVPPEKKEKPSPSASPAAEAPAKVKRAKSGFSIQEALSGGAGKEKGEAGTSVDPLAPQEGKPQEDFNSQQAQNFFDAFVEDLRKRDLPTVVASLEKKTLEKTGPDRLLIRLESKVQEENLNRVKGELLPWLREKLNHFGLRLESEVLATQTTQLEPYTPEEKYQYLVKKNPALAELRKKLNLELL